MIHGLDYSSARIIAFQFKNVIRKEKAIFSDFQLSVQMCQPITAREFVPSFANALKQKFSHGPRCLLPLSVGFWPVFFLRLPRFTTMKVDRSKQFVSRALLAARLE